MKKPLAIGLLAFPLLMGAQPQPDYTDEQREILEQIEKAASGPKTAHVSIVHLIAYPEKIAGRRVRVKGYLANPGIGGARLFLSKAHADIEDFHSSIPVGEGIDWSKSDCINKYVDLTGDFGEILPFGFGFTKVYYVSREWVDSDDDKGLRIPLLGKRCFHDPPDVED